MAQKNASNGKSIYFEASPFIGELQIKNHLFKTGPFEENAGMAYGGTLSFGMTFKYLLVLFLLR